MSAATNAVASRVEELVGSSHFIFRGTVERLHAATMPTVPLSDRTAVVRVDEVLQAPTIFEDQSGSEITVQLQDGKQRTKEGQQAVFFTNGWLYGETIAVVEVGRLGPKEGGAALRQQIAEANQHIAEQALTDRLRRAQVVIVGQVVESRPVPEGERRVPITEHDPDWWEAVVQVESVEKGRLPQKRLPVLFPNSTDEMWIESPKFRQGERGIWILQRDQKEKGWPSMRRAGYTALNPLDFQPARRLALIRRLIKGGG